MNGAYIWPLALEKLTLLWIACSPSRLKDSFLTASLLPLSQRTVHLPWQAVWGSLGLAPESEQILNSLENVCIQELAT